MAAGETAGALADLRVDAVRHGVEEALRLLNSPPYTYPEPTPEEHEAMFRSVVWFREHESRKAHEKYVGKYVALLGEGVLDSDPDRADACVVRLAKRFGDDRVSVTHDLGRTLADAHGLVNATPVGMHSHPGMSVPGGLIRKDLWVSDVVYFPLETELIALARARGCRVVHGGGMAVHQAVGAFEYFTGRPADARRMSRHFEELTA